ncbi:hypothetical protein C1X59_02550 [Pseudomonas sp. FW215-R2]|jgi:hypothetical protein|uniref:DUF2931 family protein n=1 Tax=unclassified Pseudomonas TaxID=196821 RepID=UPI000C88073A|nr:MULTISPECIES: DUF2931 family protein [unclassified Pseudomonas]PMX04311.1 hypothetical protein C1X59_02550 [Pseudomonas sp. FW215-R2]PMX10017.1 hypothetical protein C1X60_11470 [Pseudomonas sp. FW215-L1]PMX26141.1 hypothetical protein C1X57_00370 [Pseudomonas sp. FW215-E1]PNA27081.1 hypothetical protein C1X58_19925 [Pseudomonas sp. FW215-R4]
MRENSYMLKIGFALIFIVLLGGCTSGGTRSLPYDGWMLRFFTPDYMEAWIENADVVDVNKRVFLDAAGGVPAFAYPRPYSKGVPTTFRGQAPGWPEHPVGKGRRVTGAALPYLVFVRWQSMAEPQTYKAFIKIPDSVRQIMLKGERVFCRADGKWITDYRNMMVIGLAPGGIAKVWLGGQCLLSTEVMRVQGKIDPKGPYGGKTNGRHRQLYEESKAYIEKYGIPYDSW